MEAQKKKLNGKKLWLIIILVGILFVPSFYGFMYLKSYWNNGTTINKVPIAVVNLDQSYSKDGQNYNIGQSIINNLKNNNSLDWKFVDYKEGNSGLYGNKYYAMIVIPKNFSQEIANASTDGFKKPEIEFYQNQGKNYVFSEISGFGAQNIQETVSQSISKSVSNVLVQTIYKTKDGFKTAANGADKLKTGINKLEAGSSSLSTGMSKLQNGSDKLAAGTLKLQDGSAKLVNGADKLHNGSTELVTGADKLHNGSDKLVAGTLKLQSGSTELTTGINKLQNGSSKLVGGVNELKQGSTSLASGMQKLQNGSEGLQSGVNRLQNGASSLQSGINKLKAGSTGLVAGQTGISEELQELNGLLAKGDTAGAEALAQKISAQSNALKNGMESLNQGLAGVGNGATALNEGLGSLGTGVNSLNNGINSAAVGANKLSTGLNTISGGMNSLNSGLNSAATGANALNSGISSVSTGASALNKGIGSISTGASALNKGIGSMSTGAGALNNGLGTVSGGMSTLSTGLSSAQSGANKLDNGLKSANSGAAQLSTGLASGYKNLNDNVKFSAANMSDFIANPVVLNTIVVNPVSSYGEGFAPYFMCIALWVGAMYVYFVVSALSRKFQGSFQRRFVRMYLIGAILCILQALLMSTIVYFGLGMHTQTPLWFYGVNILTTLAVYSLMNGLHYIITPIMKGALIVLMVLQFTSCGGSYPVEMLPSFFRFVSPFGILTYGVNSMRMAISGINYSAFYSDLLILVLFIVFSIIIGFGVGYFRNHLTHKRVLKERSELIEKKETFNQYV